MADVFRRPSLAAELASRLLRPGVLDQGLRSGLFLSGLRLPDVNYLGGRVGDLLVILACRYHDRWCHELAPTSPETALSTVRFTV